MSDYYFVVTITAETKEQAEEVIRERMGFDEDYGFDYQLDWDTDARTVAP